MNVTGIIAEYNPFHNGHKYHLQRTLELTNADAIIAVMSGNFVQRGTPAMIDKWERAKYALLNGVDLVLELPALYSLSSAEIFAYGAISLLNQIGSVSSVCFGSESGDLKLMEKVSKVLAEEPMEFKELLKNYMSSGLPFAKARNNAIADYFKENFKIDNEKVNNLISSSNDILGIEYLKSIKNLNSNITPYTVIRKGSNYNSNELGKDFASATAIRKFIKENKDIKSLKAYLPETVIKSIQDLCSNNYNFAFEESIFPFLKYKLLTQDAKDKLYKIPDISEGLGDRIYNIVKSSSSYNELIYSVKTKRYAYTRLSRIFCQIFIGFEKFDTLTLRKKPCPYARILGFNDVGRAILKEMRSKSNIPVYDKLNSSKYDAMDLEIQATMAYSMINSNIDPLIDFKRTPIII